MKKDMISLYSKLVAIFFAVAFLSRVARRQLYLLFEEEKVELK